MKTLLVAMFLVACGGKSREPGVYVVEKTEEASCPPPSDDGDHLAARRAEVARQLEVIDRELDVIDDELAAAAEHRPTTRDDAIAAVLGRITLLQRTSPETLYADTPALLVQLANDYATARDRDAELGVSYGERHPTRVQQRRLIDALRISFERQRDVELLRATTSRDRLAQLPRTSAAPKLRQAELRALADTIARSAGDAIVPSDAPVDVRVAAARLAEIRRRIDTTSPSLGPKHPDMRALEAEQAAARTRFEGAMTAAQTQLAAQIAALDTPRARPVVDPTRLARRAELAARARELRTEWERLR